MCLLKFFKGSFSLLRTPHIRNTIFNHDVTNSVLNDCVLDAICVLLVFSHFSSLNALAHATKAPFFQDKILS